MAYERDNIYPGWFRGYGVLSPSGEPMKVHGFYDTRDDAQAAADRLVVPYRIEFGSHELGTDKFIVRDKMSGRALEQ